MQLCPSFHLFPQINTEPQIWQCFSENDLQTAWLHLRSKTTQPTKIKWITKIVNKCGKLWEFCSQLRQIGAVLAGKKGVVDIVHNNFVGGHEKILRFGKK